MRDWLAEQWLNRSDVRAKLGAPLRSAGFLASQLHPDSQVLGAYVRHPARGLLAALRDSGTFEREPCGLRRTKGWNPVDWLLSPNLLLKGATPAAALATDSANVLHAVHVVFVKDV